MASHESSEPPHGPPPCPFASVLGSDDLVRLVLSAGGLHACAAFARLCRSLRTVASSLASEWADLTPLGIAEFRVHNPSFMLSVDDGVLVSAACGAGGAVGKVHLVAADGTLLRTLRPRLPRTAQFGSPRGLAPAETGSEMLYVVDRDSGRLLKMSFGEGSPPGLDVMQMLSLSSGRGGRRRGGAAQPRPEQPQGLACPQGLCAHGDRLFISDRDNHRVLVLRPPPSARQLCDVLELSATIGSCGDEPGQLYCPMGVAVLEEEGLLAVCDSMNSRLCLFELQPPHALRRYFGTEGAAPGQFRGPFGVAVSACGGLLYVAEAAGGRVQTLSTEGVPLQLLPVPGCDLPFSVCAHGARVFVSDFHGGLHLLASRRAERLHGDARRGASAAAEEKPAAEPDAIGCTAPTPCAGARFCVT